MNETGIARRIREFGAHFAQRVSIKEVVCVDDTTVLVTIEGGESIHMPLATYERIMRAQDGSNAPYVPKVIAAAYYRHEGEKTTLVHVGLWRDEDG